MFDMNIKIHSPKVDAPLAATPVLLRRLLWQLKGIVYANLAEMNGIV